MAAKKSRIMIVKDFSKIKDITFKVDDILSKDAKDTVIDLIEVINSTKERLYALRDAVRMTEKDLKCLEDRFNTISYLIENIEYETYEVEDKEYTEAPYVKFDTDVNKHIQQ